MSMTNQEEFAARLARIRGGGPNTNATIFIGSDDRHEVQRAAPVPQSKGREIAGNALYPLSLIGAFGLGLLATALGYYARFHLTDGMAIEDGDLEMALTGGIGMAVAFALGQLFRLRSKEHAAIQGAGVFVMVCAFHNLAFWAPGPMTTLFSPSWVAEIQSAAPPNSARFRGVYFPLFDEGSALGGGLAEAAPDAAAGCAGGTGEVTMLTMNSETKSAKGGHKTVSAPASGADQSACAED